MVLSKLEKAPLFSHLSNYQLGFHAQLPCKLPNDWSVILIGVLEWTWGDDGVVVVVDGN